MLKVNYFVFIFGLIAFNGYAAPKVDLSKMPEIRAQLTAKSVLISSEMAAKISILTVEEGDSFKKNQLLIAFDCAEQQAQLEKAKAVKLGAQKSHSVNLQLSKLGSVSGLDLELSNAGLLKANADIGLMSAILKKCKIYAPFSGRVAEKHAEQYQYLKAGEPILDIINDNKLTLTLLIPSGWLTWLKEGLSFKVFLEETGREYPAKVTLIGARIDPVSQSIKIKAKIIGNFKELIAGMSGKAIFSQPNHQ